MDKKSYHSICRWTFNAGKGGFTPDNMRPAWDSSAFDTPAMIRLVREKIMPRLPSNIELGVELHYNTEINDKTAPEVAECLRETGLSLAMITPGAHSNFAYGGICSLDPDERKAAEELALRTVDLAYGPLNGCWDPKISPTFVIWNGSFGYDLATVAIKKMYENLKQSIASLCEYEEKAGGELYMGFEPKPNEGHPAMLIPTVASGLLLWKKLKEEFNIDISKKGINKEFGHSEMIGLDHVHDSVEELDNNAMVHMHLNSQGYNDGLVLGGPGKYDIDHGTRINGMNIAIAGLIQDDGFSRWKGHDMQARAYDNESQALDRVVRSILSWEACEVAAAEFDTSALFELLAARDTAKAEDMMRESVVKAGKWFSENYR